MGHTLKKLFLIFILFALSSTLSLAETKNTRVMLETSHGNIVLSLDSEKAPQTVNNFLAYVKSGFYDSTIFHRVIRGFMIQGGGLTENMERKTPLSPIRNEADNGLKNGVGTVAMARTGDPHSATAQFFINTVDNQFLNHRGKNAQGWGYCVFGKVTEGMSVVQSIENTRTTIRNGRQDVPRTAVMIKKTIILAD
ncbi:MAG: peptidyl-prolyl cis-trans isomerase [Deltaproteobacteria bacterium]|jgi:peptidyl-prolyl cis-trans isomerase B (cyclophilin B)|nr:peptidyl-prolyl cis-trans isomerase [Deltaproteobacteria bacterium]MBT4640912.1 peptidyl-prolyl cis-trans isomerase [Deltaproteobacteria bacterium]MBT6498758.1 peptidyl-prolyl cis-trans isomerase [Deltaproteobacteria bacterium]MBT6612412.1 peptidyl-prolyl cis-trans isomerase [Deltaproteobacteria bacterium]MBT7156191.1 peptidyl-prolyl cis-trans isomerase [Deltaproteobacteria bacterium]